MLIVDNRQVALQKLATSQRQPQPLPMAPTASSKRSYSPPPPSAAADTIAEPLAEVVAVGSFLPCKGPGTTSRRSAISGQLISGPWALLDDGCSTVSLSEAVMLSHVMRFGPHGTGLKLRSV